MVYKPAEGAKLAGFLQDLTYYLPRHRNEFKERLFDYLKSGVSVTLPEKGKFDVVIESLQEIDNLISKEIFVSFKLEKTNTAQPKRELDLEALAHRTQRDVVEHSVELSTGEEIVGDQVMCFTFSSLEHINQNVERFVFFIEQAYEPPEQVKERTRRFWDKVISASENPDGHNESR